MNNEEEPQLRRSGRTTRQMLAAPKGAVFIWCTEFLHYPRLLAEQAGRKDLMIVSKLCLTKEIDTLDGMEFSGLVLDHWNNAGGLTEQEREGWRKLKAKVKPEVSP